MLKTVGTILLVTLLVGALTRGSAITSSAAFAPQDGPVSVTYGGVYKTASIKIEPYDLTNLPGLPAGYSALDNKAYLITTTSVVGPPQVVHFKTSSITEREVFENLRIFHVERDTFDPNAPKWVDVTVLAESAPVKINLLGSRNHFIDPEFVAEKAQVSQNKAFRVTIVKPAMDALFVGPAEIEIEARATDRDRIIKEVRFLDNGELIGIGSSQDSETYTITEHNVSFGPHSITAIAIDSEGLTTTSNAANVFVNGDAKVVIKEPSANSLLEPGKDIVIFANASASSGITKVQFFFMTQLIGDGRLTAPDEYSVTIPKAWRGAYKIEAIVTDTHGVKTISSPLRFVVSKKPTISIESPSNDYRAVQGDDIGITVVANQPEGGVQKVDFFADDKLIGSAPDNGTGKFYFTLRNTSAGKHCLTALGTDELGVTAKSNPVTIVVGTKSNK